MTNIVQFDKIVELADKYFDVFWINIWDNKKNLASLGGVDLNNYSETNEADRLRALYSIMRGFHNNLSRRLREK